MKISKEELNKLGSTEPIHFMKESVDEFEKYTGKITGLKHIRPTRIEHVIKNLEKFYKEHPSAKATAFIFYEE